MAKRPAKDSANSGKAPKSLVDVAKDRYQRAKEYYEPQRLLSIEDTRFVMGDSDNGWQWPAEVYRDRATVNKKPCLTVNVTAQHCNQIINQIRQNRPSAKVSPVDDFADVETAKILGGMLRAIQRTSNADTAHDLAAEHALYGGEGYWRVLTDYEGPDSFDQCIKLKSIANPLLVFIDPDAKEPDRSDAKWGFVFEDISKDQCEEDHPDIDPASWIEDSRRGWVRQDTIRRAEYFYREDKDDTLYLLEDGTTVLASEFPADYTAKVEAVEGSQEATGGIYAGDQLVIGVLAKRKVQRPQWYWCKLLGGHDEPIGKREWPGKYLPIITVVGKELNVNGEVIRKGQVRDLKDPARMVNYSFSAAVETLALQNKIPYLASSEAIEDFEDIYGGANLDNRAYLPWNEYNDDGTRNTKPERQAPAQMATAQVQMLALSTEQMRAASGQQNANFGIKSEAASGVGIQRLKAQGEIATFHFPDNLARALKYEAVVVLDLIPKVYETKRVIRILGLDGKEDAAQLDPSMDRAFGELEGKVDKIFNPGVGKYDVAIDTGPSYQTQRQEAADAMTELASKYPPLMDVAGDLVMRTYDFPMAEELADRMKKLPQIAALQDDKGQPQVPPQVMAKMQELMEQMQAMQEAGAELQKRNEVLEAKYEIDEGKLLIEGYKAKTDRMQALAPAIDPAMVQAIVQQTLQSIMQQPEPVPPEPPMQQEMMEQGPSGPFSMGQEPEGYPPEMAATGANPGLV